MSRVGNLQDDRMSGCRSFGSNYQPCSQSRKMSIGITVGSFTRWKNENSNRNEASVLVPDNVKPSQGNSMVDGDNKKLNADITTNPEKILESSGKKNSPWVSPKSVHQKTPNPEVHHNPKQAAHLPVPSGLDRRCIGEKETSATYSVRSFSNRILDSNSNKKKEKMSDKMISKENKKKDGSVQAQVPGEVAADIPQQNNKGCETLKLKLWEILGTVSSPNKDCIDSQGLNVASKPLHPATKDDTHCHPEGADKQNSDTIESDTQKPTEILRRPITRALARKKAPCRKKTIKRRNSPTTYMDHIEKDIFSFKDGWPGGLSDALDDGLPTSKRKKETRQSCAAQKTECLVHKEKNAQSGKQSQDRGKNLSSAEKSFSKGNGMSFEPKNLDKDFCQTEPRRVKEVTQDIDSPNSQRSAFQPYSKNKGLRDVRSRSPSIQMNSPVRRSVLRDVSTRSPSIQLNSPVRISPLASPITREVQGLDEHSFRERVTNTKGTQSLKETNNTKGTQSLKETNISTRSPSTQMNTPVRRPSLASPTIIKMHDVDEHNSGERIFNTKGIPSLKGYLGNLKYSHADSRHKVDEDLRYSPSGSSSEEDSEKSEDSLQKRGYQNSEMVSPEVGNGENPNLVSPLHKMFSNQKGIRRDKSSASASSKAGLKTGDKARRELMRHLEQNQDDGLTSAISLFALALERLRGKVKSITQKKSAEILKSVADDIYLQLHNAETQIQADMEKVAEHGRSKRKRLETQFQDLQGQLIVIYERFKEEVNQHVQDSRNTLEGSEALKVELRGTMEKQRSLHRKLLSQAEEAIGNKLSDAQTRIDTIHNLGRQKMGQLKNILAEVLRDGVLV